mmetsp:Transcript_33267/g.91709  ORF Transcript_33267/g.91709 Transcript_33267/m.91709 type:complete len:220 (-) Transcript_33267:353-1012(-)
MDDALLLLGGETQGCQCVLQLEEALLVVSALHASRIFVQIIKIHGILDLNFRMSFLARLAGELVKYVVISVGGALRVYTGLFKQVLCDCCTSEGLCGRVHSNLNPLPETTGIIVADRLGIAERLEDWIDLQQLVGKPGFTSQGLGEVQQHELRALCLARPRLPRDQQGLRLLPRRKPRIRIGAHSEKVGREAPPVGCCLVQLDVLARIHVQLLERVYGD